MTENNKKNKYNIIKLVLGLITTGIALYIMISLWSTISSGHPAYMIFIGVLLLVGILLVVHSLKNKGNFKTKRFYKIAGAIVLLASLGIAVYLKPFPTENSGLEFSKSSDEITVKEYWNLWSLNPTKNNNDIGLIFFPGMLVDSRAYTPLMAPLVENGSSVFIPKAPFGMSINGNKVAKKIIKDNPSIKKWIVGGHSMGGAVASGVAGSNKDIDGLLIYGSYPTGAELNLNLNVLSIYGSNDPFANKEQIDKTKKELPKDSKIYEVTGGIHEFFGDYSQPKDGKPEITRENAEQQIVSETLNFVDSFK